MYYPSTPSPHNTSSSLHYTSSPLHRGIFALSHSFHYLHHLPNKQTNKQGVVQRAYNAFPVRVKLASSPDSSASGDRNGAVVSGAAGGAAVAAATAAERKVVPANETSEGTLCIEMRIRHYHDGAMSQLLEKLANVSGRGWFFFVSCVCFLCCLCFAV